MDKMEISTSEKTGKKIKENRCSDKTSNLTHKIIKLKHIITLWMKKRKRLNQK